MRTLQSAAAMLAGAGTLDTLVRLATEVGFGGASLPLDESVRTAFGLDRGVADLRIVRGEGTLRALLIIFDRTESLAGRVAALAGVLAARAPQLHWLVFAAGGDEGQTVIASWSAERARPRVVALVVDQAAVVPSDAETLCALGATAGGDDVLVHARWLDILGRDALTRRFYRALERVVRDMAEHASGRASVAERQELALLHTSRLLFLSFLETKGWLNDDRKFLERGYAECMLAGGGYQRRVLHPLFFGTLNTAPRSRARAASAFGRVPFLNGGLFARTPLERRCRHVLFPDDALGAVYGDLLSRYRFTVREERATWSEAAVDPEMLGKAFESLMASRERRASGAFYTPHALVAHVAHAALRDALSERGITRAALDVVLDGGIADASIAPLLRRRIGALRILDPACGSGAFLVHVLEALAGLLARAGDPRPTATIRRELLTRSIFGVDVNPTAVWLCELRLWLSVVIDTDAEDPLAVPPLPNLDRHIRVGDSLAGHDFRGVSLVRGSAAITRVRERYARASGARKRTLGRELGRRERTLALACLDAEVTRLDARRRDLLSALRGRDLFGDRVTPGGAERVALTAVRGRVRETRAARRALIAGGALPFAWTTHFPDAAAHGGFDVVLGNPPWVRLHRIPPASRAAFRAQYEVFRDARWRRGADAAHAGAGFAAQIDLAALFIERSLALLRDGATLSLLVPAKLWRSLSAGGVRRLLDARAQLLALEDWSDSPTAFDAAVYPSVLVARRREGGGTRSGGTDARGTEMVAAAAHDRRRTLGWTIARHRIAIDEDPSSPWLVVPPAVRSAWDRVRSAGPALADSAFGRPQLGVKCGCNEAFVVEVLEHGDGELVRVRAGERQDRIERDMLRPLLRGDAVAPWSRAANRECLLWTHGESGAPLERLPPHAARWLAPWRHRLSARADARRGRWWSLFRTASALTAHARVIWADVGRRPRALVLAAGDPTVALNSCYVLPCADAADAYALAALLNSPLAAAWLNAVAEPARGGYRRYLGWTVAMLPIPRDWTRARCLLLPLADRAGSGERVSDAELSAAALGAFGLRACDVEPLLTWCVR